MCPSRWPDRSEASDVDTGNRAAPRRPLPPTGSHHVAHERRRGDRQPTGSPGSLHSAGQGGTLRGLGPDAVGAEPGDDRSAEGIGRLTYTDLSRLSDVLIDTCFGPLVATEERRRLIDAYASALEPNPLAGLEAALRECDIPTRIVWGTGDVTFSAADPTYLDRILLRSRGVREVADAKLFFPEEYPDLIAEEARAPWHA